MKDKLTKKSRLRCVIKLDDALVWLMQGAGVAKVLKNG